MEMFLLQPLMTGRIEDQWNTTPPHLYLVNKSQKSLKIALQLPTTRIRANPHILWHLLVSANAV